ncbi:MAG: 3-oxoadipate enol-lactonase [Pseudomonadota bacterium]
MPTTTKAAIRTDGAVLYTHRRAPAAPGAPSLVFSNSLGTDLRIWDPLVAVLPADWGLLFCDKRGHGLTLSDASDWSIEDLARDVAALMDATGTGPSVIVGLSVGGLIAQALYAMAPERVSGIVLCDTAAKIGTDEMWDTRIAAVERGGMAAIVETTMERWFTARFRGDVRASAPYRAMVARCDPAGYVATARAIRAADYRDRAGAIAVPCHAIVGEDDGSTPPALVQQTAQMIPGCGFDVIADAGHIPCVEQPAVLAALIEAHVARVSGTRVSGTRVSGN